MSTATQKQNGKQDGQAADIAEQIEILRADLGALTKVIADMGRESGKSAVSAVKDKAGHVRDLAADQAETAQLHAMELKGQADDFVRKQPATALGVAAGLGFLVGYMSSRK